ncbi:unnamed protein product, partial [Vitis vinifera]|uniref:Uncharacterized protein n=1 Tax=Vitis vinifera TaxID=29760 RepID=D7SRL6_VITVI
MTPFLPNSLITDHFKYPPSHIVLISFFLKTPSNSSLSVNPWFFPSVPLTLPTWKKPLTSLEKTRNLPHQSNMIRTLSF